MHGWPAQPGTQKDENVTCKGIKGSEIAMALKQGEVYRCPDSDCGCEVTVTRPPASGNGGNVNPRCCRGKEMKK